MNNADRYEQRDRILNKPLDPRVVVGARIEWCRGKANLVGKGAIHAIEGQYFSITWDDGRTMYEYSNLDIDTNGGDISFEEVTT